MKEIGVMLDNMLNEARKESSDKGTAFTNTGRS